MILHTILLFANGPIGHPLLGVIIPAVIFLISFAAAWLLFRHFSKN